MDGSISSAEQSAAPVTSADALEDIENCIRIIDTGVYWRWRSQNSQEPRKTVSNLVGHISSAIRYRFANTGAKPAEDLVPTVPFHVLLAWPCAKGQQRSMDDTQMKELLCEFANDEHQLFRFKNIVEQTNEVGSKSAEGRLDVKTLNEVLPLVEQTTLCTGRALIDVVGGKLVGP